MVVVDLGLPTDPVWKAFSGSCVRVPDGGICRRNTRWVHLLATAADVRRTRRLARVVAQTAGPARRTQATGGWEKAFMDATFVTAKKGPCRRHNTSRERYEVRGGGRRPRRTCRSATRVRADFRTPACRKRPRYGEGAAPWPWTPPFQSATRDCRSWI
jgi:hypothetical protein